MTISTHLSFENSRWGNIANIEQEAALALAELIPYKSTTQLPIVEDKHVRSVKNNKSKKGITKKAKANKIKIPVHDIIRYMTIPQPMAAEQLGVSISTLKRRYYELDWGRWPINSANGDENGEGFLTSKSLSSAEKLKIANIVNEKDVDEATVDPLTMKILQCVFQNEE